MYYKGAILSALGKNEEALEALESALQMDNSLKEAKAGKGKALMALGNYKQALDFFRETLEDKPESPESVFAWNGKGNAFCKLEKYEKALKTYETLLSLDYESLPSRYNRGVVLSRLKNRKKGFDESLENQLQTVL